MTPTTVEHPIPTITVVNFTDDRVTFRASIIGIEPADGPPAPDLVLIWSFQHNAWWRPNGHGYITVRRGAGLYERAEAVEICRKANIACDASKPDEEIREI